MRQAVLLYSRRGFTLLELVVVVVIIGILVTMLLPAFRWYRERSFKVHCISNLKGLYVGAGSYVQANAQWPQIRMTTGQGDKYNKAWVEILKPYGISHANWICPATQRALQNPDYTNDKTFRVDYSAGSFDEHQSTPYKWAKHPWFIERSDVHGRGPLIITSDGTLIDMKDLLASKSGSKE